MLHVAHPLTQEKAGNDPKRRWLPELPLRWISPDGQSMWPERLPFYPTNWRTNPFASKPSRSIPSPCAVPPNHSSEVENSSNEGQSMVMMIEGSKLPAAIASSDADEGVIMHMRADQVIMDEKIWSLLPEDIIEKALEWLPLTSVLRFRAVCRRWNSVLLSGRFMSSHSKSSFNRHPCFLLCTIGQFACTYDPSLGKWLTLLKPNSPGASVIASTGSLFCLGNQVTECRMLRVCNPITRSIWHLPAMSKLRLIHKITMCEDPDTNSYTIVVAGEDGLPVPNPHRFNLITEVFDSSSNTWHAAQDPPPEAKFGSDPGVWFEGAFYCLTEFPYGMVKFSPKEEKWEEVDVQMPSSLSMPSLVIARNRLMMVGRCKLRGSAHTGTVIRIWELVRRSKKRDKPEDENDHQELQVGGDEDIAMTKVNAAFVTSNGDYYEWAEATEVPRRVSDEFLKPLLSYSPFVCAGIGSSIFMTTHLSPRVLVLDLSIMAMASLASAGAAAAMGCWSWLPQDPLFPTHRDPHLLGFSFVPRFDASP